MGINKIFLTGHAGKDPKVTTFDNGGTVVQFSLATTDKGYKTQDGKEIPDRTEWHNIVVNRKGLATLASQYVHKGDRITVVGKLRYRAYEDENHVTKTIAEVYAEELEIATKQAKQDAPAPQPEFTAGTMVEDKKDDLPF